MEEKKECCVHENKVRSEKEYKDLINRLNRIEGQVRGVRKMVENSAYCPEILIQVSAINAALNSFNKVLLANHIRTCVAEDIREGRDETVDELVRTLQKLIEVMPRVKRSCVPCFAWESMALGPAKDERRKPSWNNIMLPA